MLKRKKRTLVVAVLMAVSSLGFAETSFAAENDDEPATYNLAEVVVYGQRHIAGEFVRATSNVGILGEQDAMSNPISVTSISEKTNYKKSRG